MDTFYSGVRMVVMSASPIGLLQLGAYWAQLMGLDLRKTHRKLVWAICFISGMCVALAGVIGFIGLVVPHLLRLAGKRWACIYYSCIYLAGSLLLLIADILSRSLVNAGELPVGVVTATIGAPIFIYLWYVVMLSLVDFSVKAGGASFCFCRCRATHCAVRGRMEVASPAYYLASPG